VGTLRR